MGVLNKTRVYLIGNMEHGDGISWRDYVEGRLSALGVQCFNPYSKPFIHSTDETPDYRRRLNEAREKGDYDYLSKECHKFRIEDLSLVDRSDFIFFYYDKDIPTVGAFEEFFWASRLKKPIFFVIKQGKKDCPFWVFGTIPHKYIYNSLDEALQMIFKIDDGTILADSDRWKLLRENLR